MTDTMTGTCLR